MKLPKYFLPTLFGLSALLVFSPGLLPIQAQAPTKSQIIHRAKLRQSVVNFRSGTISAINGSSLTLTQSNGTAYTVNTDSNTRFIRRFGGKSDISQFSVNDKVWVVGTVNTSNKTIMARSVRDVSLQRLRSALTGSVTNKGDTNFTLHTTAHGDLTVQIGNATFVNSSGKSINYSDVKVGDQVKMIGTWDKTLKQVTEIKMIRDLSIK